MDFSQGESAPAAPLAVGLGQDEAPVEGREAPMIDAFGRRLFHAAPASVRAVKRSSESGLPWATERILERLTDQPRYEQGQVELADMTLDYIDGASLASAFRAIFGQGIYAFDSDAREIHIIDGGANIGLASIFWKRAYPTAEIAAFEPDESAFAALASNLERLGLSDVSIDQAAIWTESGEMTFAREGGDGGRLSLEAQGPAVRTVAMADLLGREVDFLKLDIEGAETEVLASAADELRSVKRLFVEYHSFVDRPQSLDVILSILTENGFRYWLDTEFVPSRPFVRQEAHAGMDLRVNISALRAA